MAERSALGRLREMESELRASGVAALYLFGSFARGEEDSASDLDLFCDLDPRAKLGLAFFALADRLSAALGLPVDLMTREGLHPLIRDEVTRTAVRVF